MIVIGILFISVGLVSVLYGNHLNNNAEAVVKSFLNSGNVDPGATFIGVGIAIIVFGMIFLGVGIAFYLSNKNDELKEDTIKATKESGKSDGLNATTNNNMTNDNSAIIVKNDVLSSNNDSQNINNDENNNLNNTVIRFCPYCGTKLYQDASFCTNCGSKIKTN